jgi:hypothetical protein
MSYHAPTVHKVIIYFNIRWTNSCALNGLIYLFWQERNNMKHFIMMLTYMDEALICHFTWLNQLLHEVPWRESSPAIHLEGQNVKGKIPKMMRRLLPQTSTKQLSYILTFQNILPRQEHCNKFQHKNLPWREQHMGNQKHHNGDRQKYKQVH